jgi:pilus assembly protein CpaE
MPSVDDGILRVLIVHADEATREAIEQALRRVRTEAIAVYGATSPTAGMQVAERLDPQCILLDLGDQQDLALEVARGLRGRDRLIVGLVNTLIAEHNDTRFLRRAVRAGVADFVPLPASDDELAEALDAVGDPTRRRAAGHTVGFVSPKGGVGTTTLAVNSGLALARSSTASAIALCDGAIQFGGVAGTLGLVADHDLADLVRDLDQVSSLSSYLATERQTGLRVLAAPSDPRDAETITPDELSRILVLLRGEFDEVIVDLPSTFDLMTLSALELCESVYVVTEALAPTILRTRRFLDLLREQGFDNDRLLVIVNRYSEELNLPRPVVSDELGREVEHFVPYEAAVVTAENEGSPLMLSAPSGAFVEAVDRIAAEMSIAVGGGVPVAGRVA